MKKRILTILAVFGLFSMQAEQASESYTAGMLQPKSSMNIMHNADFAQMATIALGIYVQQHMPKQYSPGLFGTLHKGWDTALSWNNTINATLALISTVMTLVKFGSCAKNLLVSKPKAEEMSEEQRIALAEQQERELVNYVVQKYNLVPAGTVVQAEKKEDVPVQQELVTESKLAPTAVPVSSSSIKQRFCGKGTNAFCYA